MYRLHITYLPKINQNQKTKMIIGQIIKIKHYDEIATDLISVIGHIKIDTQVILDVFFQSFICLSVKHLLQDKVRNLVSTTKPRTKLFVGLLTTVFYNM